MKKISVIVLFVFTSSALFASYGGVNFEVLHKTLGARALAMGEASVASPDGITAVYWNPACLDSMTKNEIYAGAELLLEGGHMEYMSYAMPWAKYGAFGFSAGYLDYGDFEVVDEAANPGGNSSYKDIFLTAGYGKTLFAGLQAGLTMKVLMKTAGTTTTGFNADVSFRRPFDAFNVGVAFKNVIPLTVSYQDSSEKFVSTVRAGVSAGFLDGKLKAALDMEKYFIPSNPVFFIGAEYGPVFDMVNLRLGYNTFGEISGGLGFTLENMNIDYALVNTNLALSHKIGLKYFFGGYEVLVKAHPDNFSPVGAYKKTYIRTSVTTKYEVFKWSLELKDNRGNVVRVWQGAGKPDAEFVWDGLKQDGMPFEDGVYRAVLTVTDENDTVIKSKETKITIKSDDNRAIPLFSE
ncbi:MAG: PorV/PorQ family protein [Spirochaetia bacterium]|nr:PorV/PorQ family protein [Spirochaetia bacterium]